VPRSRACEAEGDRQREPDIRASAVVLDTFPDSRNGPSPPAQGVGVRPLAGGRRVALSRIASVVIVNWNTGPLLGECLKSLWAHSDSIREVIVVDNASIDGSADVACPNETAPVPVRLVRNDRNVGFAAASNVGIRGSSAPYVFLLNPDTEVKSGAIERLLDAANSDARVGACAPKLLAPDGSVQANAWRTPPAAWHTLVEGFGMWRLLPQPLRGELLLGPHWGYTRRRRVGAFSGAAILARRQVFETVGGFDERFHMYGEDGEWCLRASRAGWWLLLEPAAEVVHVGGRSAATRWTPEERRLRELQGFLDFQDACLTRGAAIRNSLAQMVVALARWCRAAAGGRATDSALAILRLHGRYLRTSPFRPRRTGMALGAGAAAVRRQDGARKHIDEAGADDLAQRGSGGPARKAE
jgi:N-acetylglucosaminyl-diphospho-decaprenol L-rhamnosyltransferase